MKTSFDIMLGVSRTSAFWCISFFLKTICTVCAVLTRFSLNNDILAYNCGVGEEVFARQVASLSECAVTCTSSSCRSVFYTNGTGWCQGCSEIYTKASSLVQVSAARYYTIDICPVSWVQYSSSCYFHTGGREWATMTFYEAWDFCVQRNSHLAYIEDSQENAFLTTYLQNNDGDNQHFIGYKRPAEAAEFQLYPDGPPMVYANWFRGFPETEVLDFDQCLVLRTRNGNMRHYNCTILRAALCEMEI